MNSKYVFVIGLLLCGGSVPGCFEDKFDSIHFYGEPFIGGTKMDFGRLPEEAMIPRWNNEPIRGLPHHPTYLWDNWTSFENDLAYLMLRARNLEVQGNYAAARRTYRQAIKVGGEIESWNYREALWQRTSLVSFIRDREEVFALGRSPSIEKYLKFRRLEAAPSDKARIGLEGLKDDSIVGIHARYALLSASDAEGYLQLAATAPSSPRAPAALIMAVRELLQEDKPSEEKLTRASRAVKLLLTKYAKSPYYASAIGWKGRLLLLHGRTDDAIKCYFRQLKAVDQPYQIYRAYDSLARVYAGQGLRVKEAICWLHARPTVATYDIGAWTRWSLRAAIAKLTVDESKELQSRIRRDPQLLASYLDYRLEDTKLDRRKEENLCRFANSAIGSHSAAPAEVLVRIAQLNYMAGKYRSALSFGSRASRRAKNSLAWSRAEFIAGASLNRLGRRQAAIARFRGVATRSPQEWLRHCANENLALLLEGQGQFVEALRTYIALDYRADVAYLADVKLSTSQLSRFLGSYHGKDRPAFQYALAMRYMRKGDYHSAKRVLLSMPRPERSFYGMTKADGKEFVTQLWPDRMSTGPTAIQFADALIEFDRRFKRARSADAKAQALYDKGAYIYNIGTLSFYSAGLWHGGRVVLLEAYWNDSINGPADRLALERHSREHENYSQALKVFERIVSNYPHTKIIPKALYSAALAAERLSNLNEWWRAKGLPYKKKSVAWLKRIATEFPNDVLAKPAAKYMEEFEAQVANWRAQY